MKQDILSHFTTECPWRDTLYWYPSVESTNTLAKALAQEGAPHGTVLIAGSQSGGRGRLGRNFSSPEGLGLYYSAILRPQCKPESLMHLTCAVAVAACDAVKKVTGLCPSVKWINDLVCGKQKLGGILTELSVDTATGLINYAVIGIGINCTQQVEDFPSQLQDLATSLYLQTTTKYPPAQLAAALTESLYETDKLLLTQKAHLMDRYKKLCMTLGQPVCVIQGEQTSHATAIDLDEDGGLIVRYTDGQIRTVCSGEVSIRGMYGYV